MSKQFLVDISPEIKLPKYKLILTKLNEEPLGSLKNITGLKISPLFVGVHNLSFNVPLYVMNSDGTNSRNKIYDLVEGDHLVKLNDASYFIIVNVKELADDSGKKYKEVQCKSREYSLISKRLTDYNADSRVLYDQSDSMLDGLEKGILNYIFKYLTKSWILDYIDPDLILREGKGIHRALSFSDSNLIQVFMELQKTFNCIFTFDRIGKKVSVYDIKNMMGQNKGLYISDTNFIKSITKDINSEGIITRLFLRGQDGVSIQSISPTGQPYIDNFEYYKNTKYMSQDLVDALNTYQANIEKYDSDLEPLFVRLSDANTIMEDLLNTDGVELADKGLVALKTQLSQIQTLIDVKVEELGLLQNTINNAEGSDLSDLHATKISTQSAMDSLIEERTQINESISAKELEIIAQQSAIGGIESQIKSLQYNLDANNPTNFTELQLKELDEFIKVETFSDSNYTKDNLQELKEDGIRQLNRLSQPPIQFDVDVVDFLSIVQCEHVWKKFVLGDVINLEHKEMGFKFVVKLVGYDHDIDSHSLTLKFSNTNSYDDPTLYERDLMEHISNVGTTVNFNTDKWNDVGNIESRVAKLVDSKLEEARQNILNAVGQKYLFGDNGLWLYKENSDGTLDDAQIRAINSDIVLTDDNFATVKTAISAKDGINAEVIRGKLGKFATVTADQIKVGFGDDPPNLDDVLAQSEKETQDKIDLVSVEISDIDDKVVGLEDFSNIAFKDGILDMAEKESLSIHIQQLNNEKSDVDAKYTSIYADVNLISTPKSALLTAKTNYNTSHNGLLTTINNAISDSKVVDAEKILVNNAFADYRLKLSALSTAFENAIRAIESKKADTIANNLIVNFDTNVLVPAISGVQSQIDGKIDTWFYAVAPTLTNAPASSWTTNVAKDYHIDDLYYNTATGFAYRFTKVGTVYSWKRIMDSDITKALDDASAAGATADGKMTVFIVQPTTPYHEGDLWRVSESATDLKICTTTKLTGVYATSDWSNATNVGGALSSIGSQINDFSSDLKLTLAEANSLKISLESVTSESTELINTATSLEITTQKTDYSSALTTLTSYLNTNWLNKTYPLTITVAQRTNVTNYFKNLENRKSILLTKIAEMRAIKEINDKAIVEGVLYNGVITTKKDGLVATRSDNKAKTIVNATDGIKIQGNINGVWKDNFYVDLNGRIQASNIIMGEGSQISWGNINNPPNMTQITKDTVTTTYINAMDIVAKSVKSDWVYAGNIKANQLVMGGLNGTISFDALDGKPNTTKIDANGMYTGTLTAGQINAIQGITLGSNATINWGLMNKPTAAQVGALPVGTFIPVVPSYITSTKITSTTIESPTIIAGNLIGGVIKTSNDINKKRITLNEFNSNDMRVYDDVGSLSFIMDYDILGAGTPEEAQKRVFLRTENEHALKIMSQNANMSISTTGVGKTIFINGDVRFIGGNVSMDGNTVFKNGTVDFKSARVAGVNAPYYPTNACYLDYDKTGGYGITVRSSEGNNPVVGYIKVSATP